MTLGCYLTVSYVEATRAPKPRASVKSCLQVNRETYMRLIAIEEHIPPPSVREA